VLFILFFIFFFQAEDGIRDRTVTGVQTCALPIFSPRADRAVADVDVERARRADGRRPDAGRSRAAYRGVIGRPVSAPARCVRPRSEERRVGKEGGCLWGPCD